ncbi:hypothetical protein C0992_007671 [Termitomyces sp. T32_za158]|nr:hypothetical protein C0992_007671 [Termitomyces sp. T32_za158]
MADSPSSSPRSEGYLSSFCILNSDFATSTGAHTEAGSITRQRSLSRTSGESDRFIASEHGSQELLPVLVPPLTPISTQRQRAHPHKEDGPLLIPPLTPLERTVHGAKPASPAPQTFEATTATLAQQLRKKHPQQTPPRPPPLVLPPPADLPSSSSRPLGRRRSSLSLRTSKGKQKEKVTPSQQTDIFLPSTSSVTTPFGQGDLAAFTRLGLTLPPASESAGAVRARLNSNEIVLANHVASLEARLDESVSFFKDSQEQQLHLLNAIKDSIPLHIRSMTNTQQTPLKQDPAFKAVLSTLAQHRARLELIGDAPRSTPSPSPPPPPHQPSRPSKQARSPSSDEASSIRRDEGDKGPSHKRSRTSSTRPPPSKGGLQHSDKDVIFGPVHDSEIPDPILAKRMGDAAVNHYKQLGKQVIRSVMAVHRQPGYLSIRFKEYSHAFLFRHSVRRSPPVPGQEAYFASEGREAPDSDDPLSILRGKATCQSHR